MSADPSSDVIQVAPLSPPPLLPSDGRELVRAVRRALEDDPTLAKAWPAWARDGLDERIARHLERSLDDDEALQAYVGANWWWLRSDAEDW